MQWYRDDRVRDHPRRCHPGARIRIALFGAALAAHSVGDATFTSPFLANHFDDFLAPFLLLSVVALLAWRFRQPRLLSPVATALVMGFAILVWEGITPMLLARSVADWRDVLAYALGALLYSALVAAGTRISAARAATGNPAGPERQSPRRPAAAAS